MWPIVAYSYESVLYSRLYHYFYVDINVIIGLLHPQVDIIYNEEM